MLNTLYNNNNCNTAHHRVAVRKNRQFCSVTGAYVNIKYYTGRDTVRYSGSGSSSDISKSVPTTTLTATLTITASTTITAAVRIS